MSRAIEHPDTGSVRQARERAEGWAWVASELRRVMDRAAAERSRLLGPDRGE